MSSRSREEQRRAAMALSGGMPRVLVVDDEPTFCGVMGDILHALGFQVGYAHSVAEALRFLEVQTPDLILTDVMMPDVDGLTLLRRVRAEPAWSHIPAIVLSAKATREDAAEARQAGADLWIPKPFSIKELRAALLSFLPVAIP
jgi:CheY-like chemotaxis protein